MNSESIPRQGRQVAAPDSQADFAHTETRRASLESIGDVPIDEDARRRFEQARRAGADDPLESFLPPPDDPYFLATLEEFIHIELEWAWRRSGGLNQGDRKAGDRPTVERFLTTFPQLRRDEIVLRLLRQEYYVRRKYGDLPSSKSYRARFPDLVKTGREVEPDSDPAATVERSGSRHFTAGQHVDRYVLTDSHATGGFGVVWWADDNKLRRKVAFKHLRDQLANDDELKERFVTEARITAQLEHPGIVPVYDIGGLEDESPYYTMRFVRGRTFEEAIREFHAKRPGSQPAAVDRLRLLNAFVAVARTMQYAHAQGVLHRDLKPQNVVLGDFGETIILDWGLARLTDRETSDPAADPAAREPEAGGPTAGGPTAGGSAAGGTAAGGTAADREPEIAEQPSKRTVPGSVQGTPAYMSPEQAAGSTSQVDHRSDIYALGSILFQLLTGHLPFEGSSEEALRTKAFVPEAPSPRRIDARVPRPLDAICRKAMAASKLDRYDSAGALVRDLERYLADAPVEAWREPFYLRVGRFMRHHRTLMTSLIASVAVLLVSLVVGVALLSASNQRERAARDLADEQREEAITYFGMARDSVDRFLSAVTDDERLKSESLEPLRRQLLQSALEFYEPLASKRPNDRHLLADYASAQLRLSQINRILGNFQKSVEAAERAVELINELNASQSEEQFSYEIANAHLILGQAYSDYGRLAEATPEYEKAQEILQKAVENDPHNTVWQFGLAGALNDCGTLYIELLQSQVDAQSTQELAERARRSFTEGIEILERLLAKDGEQLAPERISEAEYDLATQLRNLSNVRAILEDYDGALQAALQSVELRQSLLEEAPESPELQSGVASSLRSLAVVYMQTNRGEDAIAQYRAAREWSSKLAARHPDVLDYPYEAAVTSMNIAENLRTLGRAAESAAEHENAVKILRRLVKVAPDSLRFHNGIARAQRIRAYLAMEQRDADAAIAAYDEAIGAYRMVVEREPRFLEHLAQCELNAAGLYAAQENFAASEKLSRACIDDYKRVVKQQSETAQQRANRAKAWLNLGQLAEKQGRDADAEAAYRKAIDFLQEGVQKFPDAQPLVDGLANVEKALTTLQQRTTDER